MTDEEYFKRREKELNSFFEGLSDEKKILAKGLIEEIIDVEKALKDLRKKPFWDETKNLGMLIPTENIRLYKNLTNIYNNDIKTLNGLTKKQGTSEESPLQNFLKNNDDKED